jgi:UDP-N-acetylmuramyl pentapeptide phosphotransferase/UDP-N-acetylglucosamine-1-phosphate transferase
LFLGDVGSLPIGLLLAWLLIGLAGSGHLAAALLLPLYYLADSTITLLRRFLRGDSIMQAHRQHFYQKAVDNGLSVSRTVSRVFATNVALVGAASLTLYNNTPTMQVTAVTAGATLVAALLWRLHKVSC